MRSALKVVNRMGSWKIAGSFSGVTFRTCFLLHFYRARPEISAMQQTLTLRFVRCFVRRYTSRQDLYISKGNIA